MARNKILVFSSIVLVVFFSGCFSKKENYFLSKMNTSLKEQKKSFGIDYKKTNLLSHFPDNIMNNGLSLHVSPPSCPPSFKCSAQFGNIYLICKIDTTNNLIHDNILFDTEYLTDSNIVVNLSELRRSIFPVAKCNQWFANKKPIPYFESFNFGMGEKEEQKKVDGETHYNYTYTIPSDLHVYVIKAESGNFWKEDCNETRPALLKEWQSGYSKGVAISEKENIIVYWTMIW